MIFILGIYITFKKAKIIRSVFNIIHRVFHRKTTGRRILKAPKCQF